MMPRIFWLILVATLVVWVAMNLWSVPQIEESAGGLRLLDMRFTGYSYGEVHQFLTAISDDGTRLYLGVQYWLDMIFPPLLGVIIFLFFRWLYSGFSGLVIGAISLTYVAADLLENFAIAALLRAGPDRLTPEMVATANQWTTMKWGLSLIGLAMLAIGVARRLWRAGIPGRNRRQSFAGRFRTGGDRDGNSSQ